MFDGLVQSFQIIEHDFDNKTVSEECQRRLKDPDEERGQASSDNHENSKDHGFKKETKVLFILNIFTNIWIPLRVRMLKNGGI